MLFDVFLDGSAGKESTCNARDAGYGEDVKFDPWIEKISWRRKWISTPVALPEKFHEQRSLVSYSLWGSKELDMAELLHTHTWYLIL